MVVVAVRLRSLILQELQPQLQARCNFRNSKNLDVTAAIAVTDRAQLKTLVNNEHIYMMV